MKGHQPTTICNEHGTDGILRAIWRVVHHPRWATGSPIVLVVSIMAQRHNDDSNNVARSASGCDQTRLGQSWVIVTPTAIWFKLIIKGNGITTIIIIRIRFNIRSNDWIELNCRDQTDSNWSNGIQTRKKTNGCFIETPTNGTDLNERLYGSTDWTVSMSKATMFYDTELWGRDHAKWFNPGKRHQHSNSRQHHWISSSLDGNNFISPRP